MANISLATVSLEGEVMVSFTHPQDMLQEGILSDSDRLAGWLNHSIDDFCTITCLGGMVLMCYPIICEERQVGYVLAGPVWEMPPNREQRQELANQFNWTAQQVREAIVNHPSTIPLDLSSGREITIALAELTSEMLQLHNVQNNSLNTFRNLYDVSTKLGSSLEFDEIINYVLIGAMDLMRCQSCTVAMVDERKRVMTVNFRSRLDRGAPQVNRIPISGNLDEYMSAYAKAQVLNINGISSINLPIMLGQKVRGYIELVSAMGSAPYTNEEVELLQIMTGHASSAIEKALIYSRAVRQFEELEVLQQVGLLLNTKSDIKHTLRQILEHTCRLLNAKSASILLLDENRRFLRVHVAKGLSAEEISTTCINISEHFAGQVILTGQPAMVHRNEPGKERNYSLFIPLTVNSKIIGVLYVRSYADAEPFSKDDFKLAMRLSSMSSASIETSELHEELQSLFLESITALANSIDARDSYTRGHSERVADYSLLIGEYLNLSKSEMWRLRNAALLHDIGKIKIRDSVLNKPDKLTDAEFEEMKLHPVYGAGIMHPVKSFSSMVPYILHHHEKYDGSGYPDHKSGDEIPFYARIISVGDAFDAMTSTRPYRRCMDPEIALGRLIEAKGTQLDPYLVTIFEILYKQGRIAPIIEKARAVEEVQDSRQRISSTTKGVVFFNSARLKSRAKKDDANLPTSLGVQSPKPSQAGDNATDKTKPGNAGDNI